MKLYKHFIYLKEEIGTGEFDYIKQMIILSAIKFRGTYCKSKSNSVEEASLYRNQTATLFGSIFVSQKQFSKASF